MGKEEKKELIVKVPKKVQKTDVEIADEMAWARKKQPQYAAGLRAFRNGESVCVLPATDKEGLPIEWLYGFIDGMASEVRSR